MKFLVLPMWADKVETLSLADILSEYPANQASWRFFEFEGMGKPPIGLTMVELNELCLATGYSMSWREIKEFADGLRQTWNCLIVASQSGDRRTGKELGEWGTRYLFELAPP